MTGAEPYLTKSSVPELVLPSTGAIKSAVFTGRPPEFQTEVFSPDGFTSPRAESSSDIEARDLDHVGASDEAIAR